MASSVLHTPPCWRWFTRLSTKDAFRRKISAGHLHHINVATILNIDQHPILGSGHPPFFEKMSENFTIAAVFPGWRQLWTSLGDWGWSSWRFQSHTNKHTH